MNNEVDAVIEAEKTAGDARADAFAAIATVCLLVGVVIFWLSNQ